jgi:hypothetical protein
MFLLTILTVFVTGFVTAVICLSGLLAFLSMTERPAAPVTSSSLFPSYPLYQAKARAA